MICRLALIALLTFTLSACSKCDQTKAMNKYLALGKVQARMFADGGEGTTKLAAFMQTESGIISELIAQNKYDEACVKADDIAKQYKIDLDKEQKDMITYEQLAKDGGKGSGPCSIADAAKKQMDLHALLQKEVDAGRKSSDIFRRFGDDTRGYAEMLSTNPSAACKLFDDLKVKYGVGGASSDY